MAGEGVKLKWVKTNSRKTDTCTPHGATEEQQCTESLNLAWDSSVFILLFFFSTSVKKLGSWDVYRMKYYEL